MGAHEVVVYNASVHLINCENSTHRPQAGVGGPLEAHARIEILFLLRVRAVSGFDELFPTERARRATPYLTTRCASRPSRRLCTQPQ